MDFLQSFAVSAAGMSVERARVEVASMNLANANTVQDPRGASYRPLTVVARALPAPAFGDLVDSGLEGVTLPTASIEPTDAPPRIASSPGHPFADEHGLVTYPGVDSATEMVTLMSATRAYEANVAAMNTARALALKTLEIGRGT